MNGNPRIPFELSSERPRLSPPSDRPLIVQLIVNIENWRFDKSMPRKVLTAPHGLEATPDIPNYSWAEYGMRCGMPRLLRLFSERGLPVGCSINAAVIDNYRPLAEQALAAGWEFIGHGFHQTSVQGEVSEKDIIAAALEKIKAFTGKPVQGWLSPGLKETSDTPDILKAHGVRYCYDWVLDDLPCWMTTKSGPLLSLPYSLEINDSVLHAVQNCPSDEFLTRLRLTVDTLEPELEENPRVITLGLHPHLMGVPHRFGVLKKCVDLLMARKDTIFMTGRTLTDWFEKECPAP